MIRTTTVLAAVVLLTACQTAPTKDTDDSAHIREGAGPVSVVEAAHPEVERKSGSAEVIVIELDESSPAPAQTMGDMIRSAKMKEAQQKFAVRQADCNDRVQFASGVVQMRDQNVPMEKVRESLTRLWPQVEETHGGPLPHWLKLEYERIINVMERDNPTDHTAFATWFAEQCIKHGPWLNPAAQ